MTKLTKKEAIEQGFESFIYENGDRFQRAHSLTNDEIEFNKSPTLLERHYTSPSYDEEMIKDIIANELEGNYYSETGDDDSQVYDLIMELDLSDVADRINKKLEAIHYYRNAGIRLIKE